MHLSFKLTAPWPVERVRALFEQLAATLQGAPVSLQCVERKDEPDANGQHPCFVSRWTAGEISLAETVQSGSGNPRDGYGYELSWVLQLPEVTLTLRSGGWEPTVSSALQLDVTGTAKTWLQVREALRAALGAEADQSNQPWVVRPVVTELTQEGDLATALELARASLAKAGPAEYGREELIEWLAEHDPQAGGAATRVKEAPASLSGWLQLEKEGGAHAEVFARLCPFDAKRWAAAGLPPAPWFAHPLWPGVRDVGSEGSWKTVHLPAAVVPMSTATAISAALSGWQLSTHWRDVSGEALEVSDPQWRCQVARRARVMDGEALPRVHVTVECSRREADEWSLPWRTLLSRPLREQMRWTFIGGPSTGDVLLFVERLVPQGTPAAVTFTAVGSAEFIARAEQAMSSATKLRWHACTAAQSLEPWKVEARVLTTAREALEAVGLSEEELSRAKTLLACRCPQPNIGYCEHRAELLDRARKDQNGSLTAQARSAAWAAAFAATSAHPDLETERRNAKYAGDRLALAAESVG